MGHTRLYHIEAIESEYRRIDSKWLKMQYQLMLWLVVAATVIETVMFFVLREMAAITASSQGYVIKYILTPFLCNLLLSAAATLAMRSGRLTDRKKVYTVSLLLAAMAFVLYTVHSVFYTLFLIFTIPMILTIVYGDQVLTGVTGLVCILGKAVSDLWLFWDPDRAPVLSTSDSATDFGLSLLLLALFYIICRFLIQVEQEKNNVGINLEQERQQYQEESMTDGLTRVWNRQALREAFQGIAREQENRRFFLAMMDLDDFKSLNDTYGHSQGDQYLKALGQVLLASASERAVPFRFGGDEFCVLFCGCTPREVQTRCGQIQEKFSQEGINRTCREVSISIGVAEYRRGERPVQLLDRADAALYRAKQEKGSVRIE